MTTLSRWPSGSNERQCGIKKHILCELGRYSLSHNWWVKEKWMTSRLTVTVTVTQMVNVSLAQLQQLSTWTMPSVSLYTVAKKAPFHQITIKQLFLILALPTFLELCALSFTSTYRHVKFPTCFWLFWCLQTNQHSFTLQSILEQPLTGRLHSYYISHCKIGEDGRNSSMIWHSPPCRELGGSS